MNTSVAHQRSNVLVYGIGHSGTSIITRMLFALGWKEGGPPGCTDEAFAEHAEVRECNRFALAHGFLPERATEVLASLEQPWAVKDPRLVLTLPLWKASFLTGGLCLPLLLWVTRDLDEVKQSYSRRRELVRALPGSHGHTVDELWDQAVTNYATWLGPKLQIDYADVAAAASLFVPRSATPAPDESLAGAAQPCS